MKPFVYILARRTAGKKWVAVAGWQPDTDQSCLATAEHAFAMAGYRVEQLPAAGGCAVNWASVLRSQKNYAEPADIRPIVATVGEVTAWRDLARAREYIANGWGLESQPEAKRAAISAGLTF